VGETPWERKKMTETKNAVEMCKVGDIKAFILRRLLKAEDNGKVYNGAFGADKVPCTYWIVGDCIITYLTDDEYFNAEMLTEDMMDELIIEER
jgi:hypothetical protein